MAANKVDFGDKVKIITKNAVEEGILIPSPDESVILIKLDSGYNVGLNKKEVKEIKLVSKKAERALNKSAKIISQKGLKTIMILHCGGTIASRVDYETGAVKAKFSPEELLEMFPELGGIANIQSKLVANMFSDDMRFAHYNIMAKEIAKAFKEGADGIILTQGTDTLHYTAAALTFALEGLNGPVIIVGSQRSSDRGSSDAFMNLKCAAQFIAQADFKGVAICLHANSNDERCVILPGFKSRKMHSSRRDAFKAVNAQPYAYVSPEWKIESVIEPISKNVALESGKLVLKLFNEKIKVGILKSHPQMFAEEVKAYGKFDGLILEGTGLGHFPVNNYDENTVENGKILLEIKNLAKKMPVVMTTQTIFGMVNMNVYSTGRDLIKD